MVHSGLTYFLEPLRQVNRKIKLKTAITFAKLVRILRLEGGQVVDIDDH